MDWVDALVDLARSAREDPLPEVLLNVCETVRRITGFQNVVFNLYRPAWDDFEAVIVVGADEARDALLGMFANRQTIEDELFRPEFEEAPGVFLVPGESDAWDRSGTATYTPEPTGAGDGSWSEEEGLLVRLQDSSGQTFGFLSVDEPVSGRRPTQESYRLLRAVCSHAEQVFELTQASTRANSTARRGEALVSATDTFAQCAGEKEVLAVLADLAPTFGFDRAAAYLRTGPDLELAYVVGFPPDAPVATSIPVSQIEQLLGVVQDRAGTYLVARDAVHGEHPDEVSSRNGKGPAAWHEHALLVPARATNESLHALLVVEDPSDRLLPYLSVLRVLRILVDRASGALDTVVTQAQLAHLATHDALTGLRNRRALDDESCRPDGPGAVLVCDLDHFKQINDSHGHRVGDEVLARFADVLREAIRQGDIAVRLGGEEFAVLLGGLGREGALAVAHRIVAATEHAFDAIVTTPVTVSIGATLLGDDDLYGAIDRADVALYDAKAAGRNQAVFRTTADLTGLD